jgi:hypothetical protein
VRHSLVQRERRRIRSSRLVLQPGFRFKCLIHHGTLCIPPIHDPIEQRTLARLLSRVLASLIAEKKLLIVAPETGRENRTTHRWATCVYRREHVPSNSASVDAPQASIRGNGCARHTRTAVQSQEAQLPGVYRGSTQRTGTWQANHRSQLPPEHRMRRLLPKAPKPGLYRCHQ